MLTFDHARGRVPLPVVSLKETLDRAQVAEIFNISGFMALFTVCADLDAALALFTA